MLSEEKPAVSMIEQVVRTLYWNGFKSALSIFLRGEDGERKLKRKRENRGPMRACKKMRLSE